MFYIDLHCDTIMKLRENEKVSIISNPFMVDVERLNKVQSKCQCLAIYYDSGGDYSQDRIISIENDINGISAYNEKELKIVKSRRDYKSTEIEQKIILTIEDGGLVCNHIDTAYDLGIRLITLSHNYNNPICDTSYNSSQKEDNGLTKFGVDFIERMNELGVVIDLSHASDQTFWDVLNVTRKPFIASHSNSRTIVNHERNLTDEMIKAISESGGIIGINFSTMFVSSERYTLAKDLYKHIEHIWNIGGSEVLALGSDYDGIPNVTDFGDISGFPLFAEKLRSFGMKEKFIEKMMWKNADRYFLEVLK